MKKLTVILLVLVLVCVEIFAVSCQEKPDDPAATTSAENETTEAEESTEAVTERLPNNVPDDLDSTARTGGARTYLRKKIPQTR